MKLDDILREIGEFGFYQKRLYLFLCIPMISVGSFMVMTIVLLYTPQHRCKIPGVENDTFAIQNSEHAALISQMIPSDAVTGYDRCHVYNKETAIGSLNQPINASLTKCSEWVYDKSVFESTFSEKTDLVCEDTFKTSHAQMIFFFGVLVGDLILGLISDTFGRKVALMTGFITMSISSFAVTWAPEFYSFTALAFVVGGSSHGSFVVASVIGLELVGPTKRVLTGIPLHIFFTIGLTYIAGISYWLKDWHYIALACAIPTVFYLFHWWCIPESARWLASKDKMDQYKAILYRAAKVNGVHLDDHVFEKTESLVVKSPAAEEGRIWHIFTSKVLLIRTLILCFNWFVVSMTFYGVTLNAGNMAGNFYLNFFLMAVAGFPGYIIAIAIVNRIGRKRSDCMFMCVGGVACLCTIFTVLYGGEDLQPLTATLAVLGKMGASAAFCCIYLYTSELMPTVVRNASMGLCSGAARVGAMVAPYIAKSGELIGGKFGQVLPLVVFGSLSVMAGLVLLFLPETLNQELPDTIQEGENFGRKKSKVNHKIEMVKNGNKV